MNTVTSIPDSPVPTLFCYKCYTHLYQVNFLKLGLNQVIPVTITLQLFFTASSQEVRSLAFKNHHNNRPTDLPFHSFLLLLLFHRPYTSSIQVLQGDFSVHQSLRTTALNYNQTGMVTAIARSLGTCSSRHSSKYPSSPPLHPHSAHPLTSSNISIQLFFFFFP